MLLVYDIEGIFSIKLYRKHPQPYFEHPSVDRIKCLPVAGESGGSVIDVFGIITYIINDMSMRVKTAN